MQLATQNLRANSGQRRAIFVLYNPIVVCFNRYVKASLCFQVHGCIYKYSKHVRLRKKKEKKLLKWLLSNQFKVGNQNSIKVRKPYIIE